MSVLYDETWPAEARDRVCALEKACDDLNVQALFWKQAAEHAVDGWTKQEDVCIELREKLLEACSIGLRHAPAESLAQLALECFEADVLADNGDDT